MRQQKKLSHVAISQTCILFICVDYLRTLGLIKIWLTCILVCIIGKFLKIMVQCLKI